MSNIQTNISQGSKLVGSILLPLVLVIALLSLVGLAGCSSGLDIQGKWQSEAEESLLKSVNPGDIVVFDGQNTDLRSPGDMLDTYTFKKTDGNIYQLVLMTPDNEMHKFKITATDTNNFTLEYDDIDYPFTRVK